MHPIRSCAMLLVLLPVICNAIPVGMERVAYSCDLSRYTACPSEPSTSPLDDKRLPGAGRLLREWNIVRIEQDVYEISGVVVDDNAGFPKEGAVVFIGNLKIDRTLTLVARSDDQGKFTFRINNMTADQIKQWAESMDFIYVDTGKTEPFRETIYTRRKYLYVGESNIDLYQYEIPYPDAQPPG